MSQNIIIDRVRLFSYPQMGFRFEGVQGGTLSNSSIAVRPGSFQSGRADGIHIVGSNDMIVESNLIEGQGDDGLNIRSARALLLNYYGTTGAPPGLENTFQIDATADTALYEEGDKLVLLTNQNRPVNVVTITKIYSSTARSMAAPWDTSKNIAVYDLELNWGTGNPATAITNLSSDKLSEDRQGTFFNLTKLSSRFVIQNNIFRKSAGRGMLIQAPNGIVQGNRISSVAHAGILAVTENATYVDGPGPTNVGFFSNDIANSNHFPNAPDLRRAGIAIGTSDDQLPNPINFPVVQNVVLQGNIVRGLGFAGVIASRVSRMSIGGLTSTALKRIAPVPLTDCSYSSDAICLRKSSIYYAPQ